MKKVKPDPKRWFKYKLPEPEYVLLVLVVLSIAALVALAVWGDWVQAWIYQLVSGVAKGS